MDEIQRTALRQILENPAIPVSSKIREFIRLFNGNADQDCTAAWGISTEEWQRFEFLGDRVINLVAAELLYSHDPPCREGAMTKKMGVVSNESLAMIAERGGVDVAGIVPAVIGQQQAYGDAVRGGAVEACIGAMYACAGFEATRALVRELLAGEIERYDPSTNYIGRLQEYFQQHGQLVPLYEEIRPRSGPVHQPRFRFGVYDGNHILLGEGTGSSSTEARQAAARAALDAIGKGRS